MRVCPLIAGIPAVLLVLAATVQAAGGTPDWRKPPEPANPSFLERLSSGTRHLLGGFSGGEKAPEPSRNVRRPGGFNLSQRRPPPRQPTLWESWFGKPQPPAPSRTVSGFMSSPRPSAR